MCIKFCEQFLRFSRLAVNGEEENLILSFRNVDKLGLTEVNNVSVYDVLYFDKIVISKDDIKKIEEALK